MKPGNDRKWDWVAIIAVGVVVVAIFSGFIFTDRMLFGTDMIPMGYMMRQVVADHWRAHDRIPLWDPFILCGLPVVDSMHGDIFYPASVFYLLMPLHKAIGYKIVLHAWLAGITMYFLLRTLGLRRRSSLVGALGYMTAPYLLSLTYAGHDAKIFVTSLFPLCVMMLELLMRKPRLVYAALLGCTIGLLLLAAHPQMAYFASWGLGIYFLFGLGRMRREGNLVKGIALVVIGVVAGLALGSVQFLPTYYYTTNFSPRTGGVSLSFASSWSLHPEEIVSLLYPSFVGYLQGSYWGRNPFKLNAESPGPLLLLLAIGGFVLFLRRRALLPWLVLFVFCPVYALGAHTPVFKFIFYGVPAAKFLRAPSIIMFMFSCSASVLAAFFIDSLLEPKTSRFKKRVLSALIVFVVLTTVFLTVGRGALLDMWKGIYPGLGADKLRIADALSGRLAGDAIVLVAFGMLILGLGQTAYRRRWSGKVWLGIIIAGLLATSLPHSLRFIEYIAVGDFRRSDPMIEYMKQDKQLFRALPITGSSFYNRNYLPIFGIETANGFYDNRIRYYESLSQKDFANLFHPSIMRIANIKYVITTQKVEHTLLALERSFGNAFLYRNTGFLPRALIVHHAVVAESDSAALEVIKQPDFDPATTIVLHSGEPLRSEVPEAEEWARIRRPDLNKIIVDARVASPGYLFYSANYLPFWKAYVDGREVPVLRCNLSMRAIYLDPGEHTVEMKYSSPWFMAGSYVCLLSCLFVTLALVMDFRSRRKRGSRG